jgi:hypothetical protein
VACKRSLNLTVEHFPRVFVVAEWDDSHIYHTLLGPSPSLLYPLLIAAQRSSPESFTTRNSLSPTLTSRSWSP